MKSLGGPGIGDFLAEKLGKLTTNGALVPLTPAGSNALAVLKEDVPGGEAEKIVTTLEQYAASKDFAGLVNEAVAPPKAGESEDEFVERAKEAIRNVLLAKVMGR